MSERVNKLYKPVELSAAIEVMRQALAKHGACSADVVKELHKLGFRIVRVGEIDNAP